MLPDEDALQVHLTGILKFRADKAKEIEKLQVALADERGSKARLQQELDSLRQGAKEASTKDARIKDLEKQLSAEAAANKELVAKFEGLRREAASAKARVEETNAHLAAAEAAKTHTEAELAKARQETAEAFERMRALEHTARQRQSCLQLPEKDRVAMLADLSGIHSLVTNISGRLRSASEDAITGFLASDASGLSVFGSQLDALSFPS